jgi:hypothetical protein
VAARLCFRAVEDEAVTLAVHRAMLQRIAAAVRLIRGLGACAVVCSEDGISADPAVLATVRWLRLPLIDIPFGNGTAHEIEFDLEKKWQRGELIVPTGKTARLLRWIAPQWVKRGRFAGAVHHRPEVIFAMQSLALPVRDAWIIHGGMSDVLCVENEIAMEQYRRERIPARKLRATGSPYCDAVVAGVAGDPEARAALRQPRTIRPGTTRILVSWPPSYHDTYPGRSEFPDYTSMTLEVLSALRAIPGTEVTVSLHPACAPGLADLLAERGLATTDDYLVSLIARHDVFVTYFSSTIRWALAAGKPVVNYDAYRLSLPTFDEAPGFTSVDSLAALRERVATLAASPDAFAQVSGRQIAVADRWGVLDGGACQRILAEIDRLAPAAAA